MTITAIKMKKVNRKIPGTLLPPPKTEIDGKITDLTSKTISELLELRERQSKLLNNNVFISKLPDKGVKIQELYNRITKEVKAKQEEEQACQLLSNLNINPIGENSIQDIEWKGKVHTSEETYLDSDDDSDPEDEFHVLSQSRATEKIIKFLKADEPLITLADLDKICETPHNKYIVNKTECNTKIKPRGQFKPYQTTILDSHNPNKELLRKKHKNWEITAATPPPIIHGPTQILSLEESLKLQKEYNIHLKEIEAQHAAEKLLSQMNIKMSDLPDNTTVFGSYRDIDSDNSDVTDAEGSDKEVHDEEPEKGGVVFTVMK